MGRGDVGKWVEREKIPRIRRAKESLKSSTIMLQTSTVAITRYRKALGNNCSKSIFVYLLYLY